jgi:hypothetical protein
VNLKRGFEQLGHEVTHVSPEEILSTLGDANLVNRHRAWKEPVPLSTIPLKFYASPDLIFIVQNYLHFDNDLIGDCPVAYYHNEDYCGPSILNADINFYCQPPYYEFWRTFYPWSHANAEFHLSPPAVHPEDFMPAEKVYDGLSYLTDNAVEEIPEPRDFIWNEHYDDKKHFHVRIDLYDHYWGGKIGTRSPYAPRDQWVLPLQEYKEILSKAERIAYIPVEHVPFSRRLFEAAACNTGVRIYCKERDIEHYMSLYGRICPAKHDITYWYFDINAGREWVLAHHTYAHRARDIIEKVKQHVQHDNAKERVNVDGGTVEQRGSI